MSNVLTVESNSRLDKLNQLLAILERDGFTNRHLYASYTINVHGKREYCYCVIGHLLKIGGFYPETLSPEFNDASPADLLAEFPNAAKGFEGFDLDELDHMQGLNDGSSFEMLVKYIKELIEKEVKAS